MAEEWAAKTGGVDFDAPEHDKLIERGRSLGARPDLPDNLREAVRGHLQRHDRLEKNRTDVKAFLNRAGRLLRDRDRLARSAPEDRAQAGLPLTWEAWKQNADAPRCSPTRKTIPTDQKTRRLELCSRPAGT